MRADTVALLRADTLLHTKAYKLPKVKAKTLFDIISDVVGKILVDLVADTVAEVELEKLANTARDVQASAVVEMHDDKFASGGRQN